MRTVNRIDLFRIILRTFLIQASWNYQRMQNLGFCYCMMPILRRLHVNKKAHAIFMQRHLEYFNAHPYLTSYALGAVARLEEQNLFDQWDSSRPILVFKSRLCGPLGAIGDKLIWGTVRPLAALVGLFVTLLFGLWGPLIFLILYNVPHFYLRYHGVTTGYRLGFDIVREFSKRRFEKLTFMLSKISVVFLGMIIGFYALSVVQASHRINGLLLMFSLGITWIFIRKKKPIIWPVLANLALLVIFSMIKES